MVARTCLLFQLMKQKNVYSNQEKTILDEMGDIPHYIPVFLCIYFQIISVDSPFYSVV